MREDFLGVEKVLVQQFQGTLESVRLGKINDYYTITSLREFQVLKDISIDIRQLFAADSECRSTVLVNLSDSLPASIETVKVMGGIYSMMSDFEASTLETGLIAFVKAKIPENTSLGVICVRELYIERGKGYRNPRFRSDMLRKECERNGVALSDCTEQPCSTCVAQPPVVSEELDEGEVTCGGDDYDEENKEDKEDSETNGDEDRDEERGDIS